MKLRFYLKRSLQDEVQSILESFQQDLNAEVEESRLGIRDKATQQVKFKKAVQAREFGALLEEHKALFEQSMDSAEQELAGNLQRRHDRELNLLSVWHKALRSKVSSLYRRWNSEIETAVQKRKNGTLRRDLAPKLSELEVRQGVNLQPQCSNTAVT